jgi:hypothetical protein
MRAGCVRSLYDRLVMDNLPQKLKDTGENELGTTGRSVNDTEKFMLITCTIRYAKPICLTNAADLLLCNSHMRDHGNPN